MIKRIIYEIECGEKTCCNPDNKIFCQQYIPSVNSDGMCALFGRRLFADKGWVQRHQECMNLAVDK